MIDFPGNKYIKCNKMRMDNNGRIITLEVEIDDEIKQNKFGSLNKC